MLFSSVKEINNLINKRILNIHLKGTKLTFSNEYQIIMLHAIAKSF